MTKIIPRGYQIHVSTWENDGDAPATKIVSGLSKDEASFCACVAKQFETIGNREVTAGTLYRIFDDAFRTFNTSHEFKKMFFWDDFDHKTKPEDDFENFVHDALYLNLCEYILDAPHNDFYSYEFHMFCRKVEDYKIFYMPQAVAEVTDKINIDPEGQSMAELLEEYVQMLMGGEIATDLTDKMDVNEYHETLYSLKERINKAFPGVY